MKYRTYARDNGIYDEDMKAVVRIQPVSATKKQCYDIAKIVCGLMNNELIAVIKR